MSSASIGLEAKVLNVRISVQKDVEVLLPLQPFVPPIEGDDVFSQIVVFEFLPVLVVQSVLDSDSARRYFSGDRLL